MLVLCGKFINSSLAPSEHLRGHVTFNHLANAGIYVDLPHDSCELHPANTAENLSTAAISTFCFTMESVARPMLSGPCIVEVSTEYVAL